MRRMASALVSLTVVVLLAAAAPVVAQAPGSVLFEEDFSIDTGAWDLYPDEDGAVFYQDG